MSIKISVITVCYNSEKTIARTLESLIRQTYKNYELIIIDGASKDRTLNIINRYKTKFKEITIISEPDNGIYDAMNKGINLSKGEIIGFLNSDDYYDKNALKFISDNYTKDIDILYGDTYLIDQYKGSFYERRAPILPEESLKDVGMIPHTSTFVKREIMLNNQFDTNFRICADYKFFLSMYLEGKKFKYINKRINNMTLEGVSNTQLIDLAKERIQCKEQLLGIQKGLTKQEIHNKKLRAFIVKQVKQYLPKKVVIKLKYRKPIWQPSRQAEEFNKYINLL